MEPLRIEVVGRFEVVRAGRPVTFPTKKTEALLSVLALRPGVPYGREWLASLLWPDVPLEQGRTSLRQALGGLRKQLEGELVVSGSDQVHLDPAGARVDAAEIERIIARAPRDREPLATLARGPLLEAFPAVTDPFVAWLEEQRVRLEDRLASAMEECIAALSAEGELDRALVVGGRLVSLAPTRESAHRALMRLHAARGDRAAALEQYERCRVALARKLDVTPSAETDSLRQTLRTGPSAAPRVRTTELPRFSERTTLAIVPFEASPETGLARTLADALVEDVGTELCRFRQLAVVARASILSVLTRSPALDDLARETGASLVLSGSVRVLEGSSDARARITATLIDATTGLSLWAERWDTSRDDAFHALDRLTRSVASALSLRIDEVRLGESRRRSREHLATHECWLRGLECLRRGDQGADDEARTYFEQALALDPTFARAYSGISLSHFNDWSCQAWDRWEMRERLAFENARRAVELDDGDHVTHCILGRIHVYRREWDLGERHLEQALALNPNDPDLLVHASIGFTMLGAPERGRELAELALRLHPKHSDWYYAAAAFPALMARDPDACRRLAGRAPDSFVDTRALLAAASAHLGELALAREHASRFVRNFETKIGFGREPAPGEALAWVLDINPLRREQDVAYVVEGLELAGITRRT